MKICTRACVMVTGEFVLRDSGAELADRSALVASYLGERTEVHAD